MTLIKVQDRADLCRDSSTGAIINTNNAARQAYLKNRQRINQQTADRQALERKVTTLDNRITAVETKLDLIIDLLSNR